MQVDLTTIYIYKNAKKISNLQEKISATLSSTSTFTLLHKSTELAGSPRNFSAHSHKKATWVFTLLLLRFEFGFQDIQWFIPNYAE